MRWAMAALLSCGVIAAANVSPAAAAGFKLIYKVDSAAVTVKAGRMTIIASGAVETGGWSKARLRLEPGHRPENSILEFDFLAVPPAAKETVIQALVPVTITLTTRLPPHGVTQIKVNAQSNSTIAKYGP